MGGHSYEHTQRSSFMLPLFVILALIFFAIALTAPEPFWFKALFSVLSALLFLIGLVFSSLTVIVDERALSWHFGLGFWKKTVARSDIADVEAVKTKWWYGWGIRLTPIGWLYNVSGFDAVAVKTKAGAVMMIGTDEPDALVNALQD